jgi:heme oxygenase (biliverdin-IX-beta and delta-forming)
MAGPATAEAARRLIRGARSGVLATNTKGESPAGAGAGTPFASLVTPATAPDLSPLLWLSGIARHTRNLAADPRCSLLLMGPPSGPNPQTAPRVTLIGSAAPLPDPALRARWLALHPYADQYAELPDFSLWRLSIAAAHFVGGFAAAASIRPAGLLPDAQAVAAIAAAEPAILAHCNADHAAALDAIAAAESSTPGAGWRLVAVDVDGCDLARGETALRIPFAAPVASPGEVRAELVRLAAAARHALARDAS